MVQVPAPEGETLREISSAIVGLYREHFGKGPTRAKTYALDDVIVCVLRDGLTTIERTLYENGRGGTVRQVRAAFQEAVGDGFVEAVERLTGRRVLAFMSQTSMEPDLVVELFFLDRPLDAGGTFEGGSAEGESPLRG